MPLVTAPVRLDRLTAGITGPLLIGHEGAQTGTLTETLARDASQVAIVIGPEGGLAEAEVEMLAGHKGAALVSLGPRVLRAETAAITAVTLALVATNNLQPPRPRAWRPIEEIPVQS